MCPRFHWRETHEKVALLHRVPEAIGVLLLDCHCHGIDENSEQEVSQYCHCGGVMDDVERVPDNKIGVRAWLARGYFIPGGASQRGGGQAPAFRVARCRTRSLVDIRLDPVGSHQGS